MKMDENNEQRSSSLSEIFDDQTSFTTNIIGKEIRWDQINYDELNQGPNLSARSNESLSNTKNININTTMSKSIMDSFCASPSKKGINEQFGSNKRNFCRENNKLDSEYASNSLNESTDVDKSYVEDGKKLSHGLWKTIPTENLRNSNDFSAAFLSSDQSNDSLKLQIDLNKKKLSAFVKKKQCIKNQVNAIDFEGAFNSTADDSVNKSPKNGPQKLNSDNERRSAFLKFKNKQIIKNQNFSAAFDSSSESNDSSRTPRVVLNKIKTSTFFKKKQCIKNQVNVIDFEGALNSTAEDSVNKSPKNGPQKLNSANEIKSDGIVSKQTSPSYELKNSKEKMNLDFQDAIKSSNPSLHLLQDDKNKFEDCNKSDSMNIDVSSRNNLNLKDKLSHDDIDKTINKTCLNEEECADDNPVNKCILDNHEPSDMPNIEKDDSKIGRVSSLPVKNKSLLDSEINKDYNEVNNQSDVSVQSLSQCKNSVSLPTLESNHLSINISNSNLLFNLDDQCKNGYNSLESSSDSDDDNGELLTESSVEVQSSKSRLNESEEVSTYRKSLRKSLKNSILNGNDGNKENDNLLIKENSRNETSLRRSSRFKNSLIRCNVNRENYNSMELTASSVGEQSEYLLNNSKGNINSLESNIENIQNISSMPSFNFENVGFQSKNVSFNLQVTPHSTSCISLSTEKRCSTDNKNSHSLINNTSLSKKRKSLNRSSCSGNNESENINKRKNSISSKKETSNFGSNGSDIDSTTHLSELCKRTKSNYNNESLINKSKNNNKSLSIKHKNNISKNEIPNFNLNESDIDSLPFSELGRKNKRFKVNDCNMINNLLSYSYNKKRLTNINNRNDDEENLNDLDDLLLELKKKKRLKKPKNWASQNLYNFIIPKLEEKYGFKSHLRAEKFVIYLCDKITTIQKLIFKNDYEKHANELKLEMARLKIIITHYDFYDFVMTYLPGNVFHKCVPALQPFNLPLLVSEPPGSMLDNIL